MTPLYVSSFLASKEDYAEGLVRSMAFLGRYGHQPLNDMLHLPVSLLQRMCSATAELLEAEKDQLQNTVATGGGG